MEEQEGEEHEMEQAADWFLRRQTDPTARAHRRARPRKLPEPSHSQNTPVPDVLVPEATLKRL